MINRIVAVFFARSAQWKKDTEKKEYYISVGMAQGMCFGIAIYSEGGYEHG